MSARDANFIKAVRVSVSQVARILGMSRQHVARLVNSEKDFFSEHHLARLLLFWHDDPFYFSIAKKALKDFFPEYEQVVLGVVSAPISQNKGVFSIENCKDCVFWLISADVLSCLAESAILYSIKEIISMGCDVSIVVPDDSQARELKSILCSRNKDECNDLIKIVRCPIDKINLRWIPSVLLQINKKTNKVFMYGVSEDGFVPLSSQEGKRLRLLFSQIISGVDKEQQVGVIE